MVEKRAMARRASDREMLEVAKKFVHSQEPGAVAPRDGAQRRPGPLKPRAVAAMLDCKVDHGYTLIASGVLPAVNISKNPGRGRPTWRISERAVRDYIAGRRR